MRNDQPLAIVTAPFARMPVDLETAILFLALLVMIFGAYSVVRAYRKRLKEEETPPLTPQQQLEQYQAMVDEGLLLPQEFEKLRRNLQGAKPSPDDATPPSDASPNQGGDSFRR